MPGSRSLTNNGMQATACPPRQMSGVRQCPRSHHCRDETGVLLIETFKTLFSPQSDGHLGLSLVAFLAHPIRHIIIDICAVDLSWNRKNKPFRAAYFVTWNKL